MYLVKKLSIIISLLVSANAHPQLSGTDVSAVIQFLHFANIVITANCWAHNQNALPSESNQSHQWKRLWNIWFANAKIVKLF